MEQERYRIYAAAWSRAKGRPLSSFASSLSSPSSPSVLPVFFLKNSTLCSCVRRFSSIQDFSSTPVSLSISLGSLLVVIMTWPRDPCFHLPLSNLRMSSDISSWSRLSTTKHHILLCFLSHARAFIKVKEKSLSADVICISRAISLTELWKVMLLSPEIQKIPPGYSFLCLQIYSTASDVLPMPPRPYIAVSTQLFWLPLRMPRIALSSFARPQKQELRLGTRNAVASFVAEAFTWSSKEDSNAVTFCSVSALFLSKTSTEACKSFWSLSKLAIFTSPSSWRTPTFFTFLERSPMALDNASFVSDCSLCCSSTRFSSWVRRFSMLSRKFCRASKHFWTSSMPIFLTSSRSCCRLATSSTTSFNNSSSTGQPTHRSTPTTRMLTFHISILLKTT